MATPTEMLNSYGRAVERIKARHSKLSFRQQRKNLGKAGDHTAQVKMDYLEWTFHRRVRLSELWPRTDGLERISQMDALEEARVLDSATIRGTVWVTPRLCNGLLGKFLAGKITAAEAVKQEEASCG